MNAADTATLAALRLACETYAAGADRRDKTLWRSVLSEHCVIEGPGFRIEGCENNLGSLDMLGKMFRKTRHIVHQIHAEVDGDEAVSETYCTADHLMKESDEILSWSLRYKDLWRREGEGWRIAHRRLEIDWEETRPVRVQS